MSKSVDEGVESCQYCNEVSHCYVNNAFVDLLGESFARRAVLAASGHSSVIPSVGALVAGHVLVVPNEHYTNIACTPRAKTADLSALALAVYGALRSTYRVEVVAFEHGSLDGETRSGACLDHAHLHLLPLEGGLTSVVQKSPSLWTRVRSGEILQSASDYLDRGSSYLSLWDGLGWWIRSGVNVRSQELRREVSSVLGVPDRWDWGIFPNTDLMARTVQDLTSTVSGAPVPYREASHLDFELVDRAFR